MNDLSLWNILAMYNRPLLDFSVDSHYSDIVHRKRNNKRTKKSKSPQRKGKHNAK